jgi:predicted nucleic acid-binding protein
VILVDTSIWVDHFRRGDAAFARALEAGEVACHPLVVGELACGLLSALSRLPVWTRDRRLRDAALRLGFAHAAP